ncbi:spherulation-specific family 4 protein [Caballeronia sp. 15711]|uniref:spherulation-specific family 4 protein n=2 Tax=unclassified Caballeronia TaxID=2646786 RepID=UPI0039E68C75
MLKSKCLWVIFPALMGLPVPAAQAAPSNFGVPGYWGDTSSTYSGQIPKGGFIVINPSSGALKLSSADITKFKAIIANIRSQGGYVLGYVPTGYAQLTTAEKQRYSDISANLKAYKTTLGGVDGIFFDEAAYDNDSTSEKPQLTDQQKCSGTPPKWSAIRSTMKDVGISGTVVWNAGTWGNNNCFISGAQKGEHIVILEDSYTAYQKNLTNLNSAQSTANSLGVKTWLLTYAATQAQMQTTVNGTTANYVYVTDQPGNGATWNYTPGYWKAEKSLLGK